MTRVLVNREGVIFDPLQTKVLYAEDWNELVALVLAGGGGGPSLIVDAGDATAVAAGTADGGSASALVFGVYQLDGGVAIY